MEVLHLHIMLPSWLQRKGTVYYCFWLEGLQGPHLSIIILESSLWLLCLRWSPAGILLQSSKEENSAGGILAGIGLSILACSSSQAQPDRDKIGGTAELVWEGIYNKKHGCIVKELCCTVESFLSVILIWFLIDSRVILCIPSRILITDFTDSFVKPEPPLTTRGQIFIQLFSRALLQTSLKVFLWTWEYADLVLHASDNALLS